jgi:hypothetical protein
VSRAFEVRETPLRPDQRQVLQHLARKTWSYFERFVTADDHWLPPDNYQDNPREDVAHRLSPTNEGLFLTSALAAHDLGYVGHHELAALLERNLDSLEPSPRAFLQLVRHADPQAAAAPLPVHGGQRQPGGLFADAAPGPAGTGQPAAV